jgi:rhomboid family GlyGly-CTERM serine protease
MIKSIFQQSLLKNWKLFILPCCISIIAIIIAASGENITQILRYDAQAIAENQQYWRLFTAHFTHLSWPHLWLNVAGLFLIFLFFASCIQPRYWIMSFIISSFSISILIYFLNPEIQWYVGLSGVLHTLFILGGIADIRMRKWEGISFTIIILAKVIYEQIIGPLPGSEETAGGPVLVDAHFYGTMIGLGLAMIWLISSKRKFNKSLISK